MMFFLDSELLTFYSFFFFGGLGAISAVGRVPVGFIKAFDKISSNGCVVTVEKISTINTHSLRNCIIQGVLVNGH